MRTINTVEDGHGRRFLIACGTENYVAAPSLPSVPTDLAKVVELFTGLGYEPQLTGLRHDPTAAALKDGIEKWVNHPDRMDTDVLVFYYTGHGESTGPRHYLLTSDSRDGFPTRAFSTDFFAEVLGPQPRVRRVLLIIDTCYSGQAALGAQEAALRQAYWRGTPAERDEGVWVVSASLPKEEASQYAFADALVAAAGDACRSTGPTQRYVALDVLVDRINQVLSSRQMPQLAAYVTAGLATGLPPFLPNPRYDPDVLPGYDVEAARRHADMRRRSYGAPLGLGAAGWPGNYFTGRSRVLQELGAWIREPGVDLRPRVVTGAPGSGKSAVLGRIDARVDGAFLMRGRTPTDIVADIAEALDLTATTPAELVAAIAERGSTPVLVCDAIDESSDVAGLCLDVIRPLAAVSQLILGCREHVLPKLPADRLTMNLDEAAYFRSEDVASYVTRVLSAADDATSTSPYHQDEPAARAVAAHVAARAGHSFLIARVIARTLARMARRPEASELASLSRRWNSLGAAFDQDLARYGDEASLIRDILVPLAWAEGSGLPRENLWAPLATRLAGGVRYTDDDIDHVLDLAGAYVVESQEHARSVYRLYHQEFAAHLRRGAEPSDIHGDITDELLAHLRTRPRVDWFAAHPYIRTHLATHAAAAGKLDDLVADPEFLLTAAPDRLLAALPAVQTAEGICAADVYRQAQHLLRAGSHGRAATQLEVAALQRGAANLADRTAALPIRRVWNPVWSRWASESGSLVLGKLEDSIVDLVVSRIDGRLTAITCTLTRREVQFWDLADARLLRTVPMDHVVHVLALGEINGVPVLLTGALGGQVCVFDPQTMSVLAGPWHGHEGSVTALATAIVGGEPRVLSTALDGTLRMWNPRSDDQLAEPLLRHHRTIDALAVREVDGRFTVICGGQDAFARLLTLEPERLVTEVVVPNDPSAEEPGPLSRALARESERITHITLGTLDGRPVAVSGSSHGATRVWDLNAEPPTANLLCRYDSPLNVVALAAVDGEPILLSGQDDGTIRTCNLRTGELVGEALVGHHERVFGVAQVDPGGRPVIVSAGYDGTVRIWHTASTVVPSSSPPAGPRRSWVSADQESVAAIAVVNHPAGHGAFYAEANRLMKLVDVPTGKLIDEIPVECDWQTPVATGVVGGSPVLVAGAVHVVAWDLTTGHPLGEAEGHTSLVHGLAIGEMDAVPVVITGSADGHTRVWDLQAARLIGDVTAAAPDGADGPAFVEAVRLATVAGRPVVVAVTQRRTSALLHWDLRDGRVRQLPLPNHEQALDVGVVRGRPIAATGGLKTLRLWHLPSLEPWGEALGGHVWVKAVAIGEVNGLPVVITAGDEGTIRIWDLGGAVPAPCPAPALHLGATCTSLALVDDLALIGTERGLFAVRIDLRHVISAQ